MKAIMVPLLYHANSIRKFHVIFSESLHLQLWFFQSFQVPSLWSELHASPHIHIWIGHNHIWIYMDKTIWECALYVG